MLECFRVGGTHSPDREFISIHVVSWNSIFIPTKLPWVLPAAGFTAASCWYEIRNLTCLHSASPLINDGKRGSLQISAWGTRGRLVYHVLSSKPSTILRRGFLDSSYLVQMRKQKGLQCSDKLAWPVGGAEVNTSDASNTRDEHCEHALWTYWLSLLLFLSHACRHVQSELWNHRCPYAVFKMYIEYTGTRVLKICIKTSVLVT